MRVAVVDIGRVFVHVLVAVVMRMRVLADDRRLVDMIVVAVVVAMSA